MKRIRISPAQHKALEHYASGNGPGEFWSLHGDDDRLAWYRSERTLDSLERRGWVDKNGITTAGREALDAGAYTIQ